MSKSSLTVLAQYAHDAKKQTMMVKHTSAKAPMKPTPSPQPVPRPLFTPP